jgi:hypothetical protein
MNRDTPLSYVPQYVFTELYKETGFCLSLPHDNIDGSWSSFSIDNSFYFSYSYLNLFTNYYY